MKKALTLALATLLLIACDSDDNSDGSTINISENGLLVKKITQNSDDGEYGSSLIEEFSYDGNKLVEKLKQLDILQQPTVQSMSIEQSISIPLILFQKLDNTMFMILKKAYPIQLYTFMIQTIGWLEKNMK